MKSICRSAACMLLAFIFVAIGCTVRSPSPPAVVTPSQYPELGIVPSNYPHVDGSTSTLPIARIVACKVLGAQYEWRHSQANDSRSVEAIDHLEVLTNENYRGEKRELCDFINRIVQHKGTHEAYSNLIKGTADLILVARPPSEDELATAQSARVELDVVPIALDAFVFLINTQNPVKSLTLDQIRDIYSGRVRRWNDVGGSDAIIVAYQRNRNAGSQETMKQLVMKDRRLTSGPDVLVETLMSMTILRISEDPNGIAYSFFYYQELMAKHAGVSPCAINGIEPTSEAIRERTYPLVTEVYAALRKGQDSAHPAVRLREWLLTTEGQNVIAESEYVPIGK